MKGFSIGIYTWAIRQPHFRRPDGPDAERALGISGYLDDHSKAACSVHRSRVPVPNRAQENQAYPASAIAVACQMNAVPNQCFAMSTLRISRL